VTSAPRLTVLGSLNMDISVTVPRLPGPGATVLGGAAAFAPGGKGANQAVAAARLGANVRMVGCVGDDDFGRALRSALRAEGVGDDGVRTVPGVPTGLAMITVDEAGENCITVAPGANREVGAAELTAVSETPADVLIISAEVPVPAIRAALTVPPAAATPQTAANPETAAAPETAATPETVANPETVTIPDAAPQATGRNRTLRVLNLAPAPPEAAELTASGVDWLVVNESEAAAVLGTAVAGLDGAAGAAAALAKAGPRHVVVTVGAAGAAYAGPGVPRGIPRGDSTGADVPRGAPSTGAGSTAKSAESAESAEAAVGGERGVVTVPGFRVRAVDSVGAGDTFVGALAVALAAGIAPYDAVVAAAAAAATSATRPGTQSGMPRPADVLAATGHPWPIGPV
jgi:ribokinase